VPRIVRVVEENGGTRREAAVAMPRRKVSSEELSRAFHYSRLRHASMTGRLVRLVLS
jgi:hypothetical protein